jgi:excisionase family DNA binding protein
MAPSMEGFPGPSGAPGNTQQANVPLSHQDREDFEKLYNAIRQRKAKLTSPDGESHVLPESLYSFLMDLLNLLSQGKSVYLVQNQAKLTTVEAAAMIGVSRQFLVNLLNKGEIPHHLVGTHRRIYAQDLLLYKAKRDEDRREVIRELAQTEVSAGLYDRIPAVRPAERDEN